VTVTDPEFNDRIKGLREDLAGQGRAVQRMIEAAVDAFFDNDRAKAQGAIDTDSEIDRVDVKIERDAVQVLYDAMQRGIRLEHHDVRTIFTLVKVNNEFERIADCAVSIAEKVGTAGAGTLPSRMRVMANSVIGIMQTTNAALARWDTVAAQLVLASDDTTEAFREAIVRDTEEDLARGEHSVPYALMLQVIAANLGRMADHCTNVAEQVIYVQTGKVVRHSGSRWSQPEPID